MLPDRVSNPGPLTYESGALPDVENITLVKMWKETSDAARISHAKAKLTPKESKSTFANIYVAIFVSANFSESWFISLFNE